MNARTGIGSQEYMLRRALEAAGVKHGETVRATIPSISVLGGTRQAYFCHIRPLRKVQRLSGDADAALIPDEVRLHNVRVQQGGYYDLVNVVISINGAVHVRADRESKVRKQRSVGIQQSFVDIY